MFSKFAIDECALNNNGATLNYYKNISLKFKKIIIIIILKKMVISFETQYVLIN